MRITGLTAYVLPKRPNPYQEIAEHNYATYRQNGVVVIHTDEGIDGVVSARSDFLLRFVELWKGAQDWLLTCDPLQRELVTQTLRRRFHWPANLVGILDIGMWDIAGKVFGVPVYKLLGEYRTSVPAYGSTLHHGSDERFVEIAEYCVGIGLRAIKLHPYGLATEDIRMCQKVRSAVGEDVVLMLDSLGYPGPYSRGDALRVADALDELNFYWFEDPLIRTDLRGLAELRRRCRVVKIRMGDRISDLREYGPLIEAGAVDILAGPFNFGISDLMKLAHLAEANHLDMEPHDFSGGNASLHVLLAVANARFFELAVPIGVFDTGLYDGVYLEPVLPDENGHIPAPTKPGLGFEIDLEAVASLAEETVRFGDAGQARAGTK